MTVRRLGCLAVAAIAALPIVAVLSVPADADSNYVVPFKDPNSVGQIGFCDKENKPVTSGSILDVPFAMKAVSTVPAPRAYAIPGGKATLYAYSPIKNVNPGDWVSYQMAPSSVYTNTKQPMVAAGYAEPPLEYQVTNAPPKWDGLVQFRILLSAPNTPQLMQPYPTAVIRVTGDRWVMVQGNTSPNCAAGKAVNMNQVLGGKEPATPPAWAANSTANPQAKASASAADAAGVASSLPSPTDDQAPGGSATNASAADGASASASILPIALALLGGTVIGVGAFAFFASRRGSRT